MIGGLIEIASLAALMATTLPSACSARACSEAPTMLADSNEGSETSAAPQLDATQLDAFVKQAVRDNDVPGLYLAVTKGDLVIYEIAVGSSGQNLGEVFTANTQNRLASATKVLSGLAFLSMAEDGIFSLDQTLGELDGGLPEQWHSIPVWRILNHTSGIPMVVNQESFLALSSAEMMALETGDLIDMVGDLALDYVPGESWRYQQSGYAILAGTLEKTTGKDWQTLVSEHVLEPAGMRDTSFAGRPTEQAAAFKTVDGKLSPHEFPYPEVMSMGGGYDSTGSDLKALAAAMAGDTIVGRVFLTEQLLKADRIHRVGDDAPGEGYGLATVIQRYGSTYTIGHSGGGGLAEFRFAPDRGIGIVVLTNRTGGTSITTDIVEEVSEALFGPSVD